ncbi:hypothetical protein OF83DRAFT_1161619 [Amylostereum chailletii]|nr:hypothetical protein OF83DRAFT_1161619 [Amylostereum chailletii]
MDLSTPQYATFKDALARRIIALSPAPTVEDDSLDEFTSYLSLELWPALPASFHTASHTSTPQDPDDLPLDDLPPSVVDSLTAYELCADEDGVQTLIRSVLSDYAREACTPPPAWPATRTSACELCEREVPLTYHHLIPRSTHAKAIKRKWHPAGRLNAVAWLCRPCHSAVHHVANNEDLARNFYTLDLLLEREDIQRWRRYAAKQRFGVKRV